MAAPGDGRDVARLVERAKARLALPRLQMAVMVGATGGAGFLASFLLLQLGMDRMALRYPVAVGVAYLVFFLLLRLWLAIQRRRLRDDLADVLATADLGGLPAGGGGGGAAGATGGAGEFGGAGASSSFEAPAAPAAVLPPAPTPVAPSAPAVRSGGFNGLGLDLDLEGWLVALVAAALGLASLVAAVYVIYLAPVLLAEVLVDGLLLVGLYKRLKRPQPGHWARGAVRRTWKPALAVAVLFAAGGWVLQQIAPEARSIGGVWRAVTTAESSRAE